MVDSLYNQINPINNTIMSLNRATVNGYPINDVWLKNEALSAIRRARGPYRFTGTDRTSSSRRSRMERGVTDEVARSPDHMEEVPLDSAGRGSVLTFRRDAHRHGDPPHPLTDTQPAAGTAGCHAGRGGRRVGRRRQAGGRVEPVPRSVPAAVAVPTLCCTDFNTRLRESRAAAHCSAEMRLALVHVEWGSLCRVGGVVGGGGGVPLAALRPVGEAGGDHGRGVHPPRGGRGRRRRLYHGHRRRRHQPGHPHAPVGRAVPAKREDSEDWRARIKDVGHEVERNEAI